MAGADGLDPRAARLLAMLRATEAAGAPLAPQDRRASLRALAEVAADPAPPEVACEALTCPAAGAELQVRRYTPPGATGAGLLYLHGGGWTAGDLETHAGVCGALAAGSGASVFALDYRRAPEHPFPGPIKDGLAALTWLATRAETLGLDGTRLGIAGDSAGANLAAACALDAQRPALALQLLICPILDLPRTGGSRATFAEGYFISPTRFAADLADYLQGLDAADPRASPIYAVDLAGLPPTLIHAAAFDPFRDEAIAYADRLKAAGVRVNATLHPGMIHYFYALARAVPAARAILAAIGAEVRAAL